MSKAPKVRETEQERLAADVAEERESRYLKLFAPIEKALIAEVQAQPERYGAMSRAAGALGKVGSQRLGIEESADLSSAPTARIGSAITDNAATHGLGLSETSTGLQAQRLQGIEGLVQRGQGQASQAQRGIGMAADQAASRAIYNARVKAQQAAERARAIGSIAGSAAGAYQNWNGGGSGGEGFQSGLHMDQDDWNTGTAGGYGLETTPYQDIPQGMGFGRGPR